MKIVKLILLITVFINIKGYPQIIHENTSYPISTRQQCEYQFTGGTGINFDNWLIPENCVTVNGIFGYYLYLKWKNVEASAGESKLEVKYRDNQGNIIYTTDYVGPFILSFPNPTFEGGAVKNIPCYSTDPVRISLNPYINTANNNIDKDEVITSHFRWTLPAGWRSSGGMTGTFNATSSIVVIPPASSSTEIIQVQPYADAGQSLQFGPTVSLQITRNQVDFSISGSPNVYYNSSYTYTVPSGTGVNYTWQLPAGWSGQSNGSSINVVAGCNTGNITCSMTACGQTITKTLPITSVSLNPATIISGSSIVCSTGNNFSIANLPPVSSIVWTYGPNLSITSGQNNSTCTFLAWGFVNSWVKATLVTPCGTTFPLPQKNVTGGITASFTGSASVNYGGTGTWNATASGCTPPYHYEWWLREDTTPPVGAILVGEEPSLTLWSVPRSSLAAGVEQGLSDLEMLQPPTYTNYYLSLQVFDANGMRFDTQENLIIAYGDVDLIDPRARMAFAKTGETTSTQMKISPNPATDEATIELCASGTKGPEISECQVEIYDPSQMLKTKIQKIKGNKQSIRTAGWKDGVYIVRAKVGNEILTDKLVIKH